MKYFTADLLRRFESQDDAVFVAAHDAWDQAIVRWQRRWHKIKDAFPETVRRFEADHVCLHDAQLLRMGREGSTFIMVLEKESPLRDLVILTFTLDGEPKVKETTLADARGTAVATWRYEEWDLDRQQRCWFEVLLSNGWSVKLPFAEFQYVVVPQVFPAVQGQAAVAAVPRPA
jgi:hypothetical protein